MPTLYSTEGEGGMMYLLIKDDDIFQAYMTEDQVDDLIDEGWRVLQFDANFHKFQEHVASGGWGQVPFLPFPRPR